MTRVRGSTGLLLAVLAIALANEGYRVLDRQWRTYASIKVRWADEVSDERRVAIERELDLRSDELDSGRVWAYRVFDPTTEELARIVLHPSVADTSYIDRSRYIPDRVDTEHPSPSAWWVRGVLWSLAVVAAAHLWNTIQQEAESAT